MINFSYRSMDGKLLVCFICKSSFKTIINLFVLFFFLDKHSRFTIYKLRVEHLKTGLFWFVYRRFTDFQRLNDKLKIKYPRLELNLPGKNFFDNIFNPIFIEKRQMGLQNYLNQLMSNKQLLNEIIVRRFLCIDEPPLTMNDTYPSSVYSAESCDQLSNQLFTCTNCCNLEKKIDEMQLQLDSKNDEIRRLRDANNILEIKNSNSD